MGTSYDRPHILIIFSAFQLLFFLFDNDYFKEVASSKYLNAPGIITTHFEKKLTHVFAFLLFNLLDNDIS